MITILNKNQVPVGILSNDIPKACPYFNDTHTEALENSLSLFDFEIPANHPSSSLLEVEGFVIYTDLDKKKHLFQIKEIVDSSQGKEATKKIYTENGAVAELNGVIVRPIKMSSYTIQQALNYVLQESEWELGRVDFIGVKDFEIEEHMTALQALQEIVKQFGAELEYEVVFNGTRIIAKHINVLEQRGTDTGKMFTYKKDITGIERVEDSRNLVTALIGVGKGDESGTLLTFNSLTVPEDSRFVKSGDTIFDMEAFQRFNKNGRHIFGVFKDPEATTEQQLYDNTLAKLKELSKPRLTYKVDVVLLEELTGYSHEKVRLGDKIRIQDTSFTPMLLLEARVIKMVRSKTDPTKSSVELGDYVPLSITPNAMLRRLQATIFQKEQAWSNAGARITEAIENAQKALEDAENAQNTADNANNKADQAIEDIGLLDNRVGEVEADITETNKKLADKVDITIYNQKMLDIENELGQKVGTTLYEIDKKAMESEIAKKVAQEAYNTKIGQIDTAISGHETRITATETDLGVAMTNIEAVEGRLETAETNISANAKEIQSKASQEVVDAIEGRLSTAESTITQHADAISSKVEQTDFNAVEDRLSTAESAITQHATQISSKVDATVYETDKNGIVERLNTAESNITQNANAIASKVEQTTFDALEDRVDTAESTIQQHAGMIQSKVEQSTFNTLNGKVDGLEDRIGTAESTITQHANQIASKVEQSTFNALEGRVDTAESNINQQANQISQRVTKTEFENGLTNIKLGGKNLLRGTADFDTLYWSNVDTVNDSTFNPAYKMVEVAGDHSTAPKTAMETQGWKFEIGKTYTITVVARTDVAGSQLGITIEDSRINWQPKTITSEWELYTWTFESNSDSLQDFRFETQSTDNIVFITMPQIVEGNQPFPYSPASEDIIMEADMLGVRISNAEQVISEDAIVNTVLSSVSFENAMDSKADTEELGNLATKDELNQAQLDLQEYADNAVANLDLSPYVQHSQLEQTIDEFNFKFSRTGGMNLVRNSIGYSEFDFWRFGDNNSELAFETINNAGLEQLGFGSGIYMKTHSTNKALYQDITLVNGQTYTLSFYVNKYNGSADSGFTIAVQENEAEIASQTIVNATTGYEFFSFNFTPTENVVTLRISGLGVDEGIITGLMLNVGDLPLQWTMAIGEVYNANVKMDMNGIKVLNSEYAGYTQITPEEFAGYAEVNGQMEKVFTLNRDTTEMSKAKMEKEITMMPVKIVPLKSGGYNGWAFVKSDE